MTGTFNIKRKRYKVISIFLLMTILNQLILPMEVFALTSGPTQPEVQSFQPANSSNLVDLFTGDFKYNIPLFDVDGYPVNIAYNGDVGMHSEASWVGLGWNLNVGSMTRQMRGLPDDFDGDMVKKIYSVKKTEIEGSQFGQGNQSSVGVGLGDYAGLNVSLDWELGWGYMHHSYYGIGLEAFGSIGVGVGLGINAGFISSNVGANISKSYSINTFSGITSTTAYGIGGGFGLGPGIVKIGPNLYDGTSKSYNTRVGMKEKNKVSGIGLNASIAVASASVSSNGSSVITLGTPTYIPKIPITSIGGGEGLLKRNGFYGDVLIEGVSYKAFVYNLSNNYNDTSEVFKKVLQYPAYGYVNSGKNNNNDAVLQDFNRENEQVLVTAEQPYLPVTNRTFDNYFASAQGVSANYRAYRNDVGLVGDIRNSNVMIKGYKINENGYGVFYHRVRGNVFSSEISQGGSWSDVQYNMARKKLLFSEKNGNQPDYEPSWYKNSGERTKFDETYFNQYGGINKPSNIKLSIRTIGIVPAGTISGIFTSNNQENVLSIQASDTLFETSPLPSSNKNIDRVPRNELFSSLKAKEAKDFGIIKKLENYIPYQGNSGLVEKYSTARVTDNKKSHHVSEITVTKPDGRRYVYGIPVYNLYQKDVSFSVEGISGCAQGNLITYNTSYPNPDNDTLNHKGRAWLYNAQELLGYSYANLLTCVLSSDFVDVTGNGPTDDDLGDYTKFNYSQVYGEETGKNFKWRAPISSTPNQAAYQENIKSDNKDDIANYSYGEKEVWYIHSIETKNHIAEFYTSERKDGFGVTDENGAIDTTNSLKKLDKIELYNKFDRVKNGENAVPLKTVHFVYTNELCQGVPNGTNGGGKLTLKKIYFTGGNSNTGRLSPYEFYYDNTFNYDRQSVDRWGTYKQDDCNLPNSEYPYTAQNNSTDTYASAWRLIQIKLPSRGVINVNYESDEYAYVQDERAMNMVKIKGFKFATSDPLSNVLYDKDRNMSKIYIDLARPIIASNLADAKSQFINQYMRNSKNEVIKDLYFKCLVDLTNNEEYEYVEGYAEIFDVVPLGTGNTYTQVWMQLNNPPIYKSKRNNNKIKGDIQPIAAAAFQFARLNGSRVLYKDCTDIFDPNCPESVKALSLDFRTLVNGGYNQAMKKKLFCSKVDLDKSWIRLFTPDNAKKGGGCRVASITFNDSWDVMTGSNDFTYGQTYNYDLEDGTSSGVAAYEPMLGAEENSLYKPRFYDVINNRAEDDRFYQDAPVGESYYPAPIVGYSRVQVKNLARTNVTENGPGNTIYEFYTAKDYPVLAEASLPQIKLYELNPNFIQRLKKIKQVHNFGKSQGYLITLNDMHGKFKSYQMRSEKGKLIEQSKVTYKSKDGRLDNKVKAIDASGLITEEILGIDAEVVADMRYNKTNSISVSSTRTTDVGFDLPIYNRSRGFSISKMDKEFKTSVLTKVVFQYGLVDEIYTKNINTTTNEKIEAYDAESGEVLVTSVKNEFNDQIYNMVYPAHWTYEGMDMAYKNTDAEFRTTDSNYSDYMAAGDEVAIVSGATSTKAWVQSVVGTAVTLMDQQGNPLNNSNLTGKQVYIIRSGRRNMQNYPVAVISTLVNPVASTEVNVSKVISASAVQYADEWKTFCDCNNLSNANPYLTGRKGLWRFWNNYSFQDDREDNNLLGIRQNGAYQGYTPFWDWDAYGNMQANTSTWTMLSEATNYSPYGQQLESIDVLGRYSSAQYGYKNSLPVAVTSNSKYKDAGFDGFEDYGYNTCDDDHFSYKGYRNKLDSSSAHSGRNSIQVPANDSVVMTRFIEECISN